MARRLRGEESGLRLIVVLTTTYATIALLLTVCGMASLLAYSVQVRRPELAIRMALGAKGTRVRWTIVQALMVPLVGGLVIGSGVAATLARSLAGVFYKVNPTDVPTYVGAAMIILVVGLGASWMASARATAIDPMESMRMD